MSVLISGSIAYDTVFAHEGRFADTIDPASIECLNLTFQAGHMRKTFGGCAANIAHSLKQLGGDPLIWSAVGADGAPYLSHLTSQGIRTDGIRILSDAWTSQCVITTDALGNQLTTFHPGAMDRAGELSWPEGEHPSCGILAPSCREPLLAHFELFRRHNLPFIFDPGQTTPLFSGDELIALSEAATAVAFSDYEAAMITSRTGLTPADLSRRTRAVFCTHGSRGSSVWENGRETFTPARSVPAIDPVGAGDAYRGGLLYGLEHGWDPVAWARLGTLMASLKVQVKGPSYQLSDEQRTRYVSEARRLPFA